MNERAPYKNTRGVFMTPEPDLARAVVENSTFLEAPNEHDQRLHGARNARLDKTVNPTSYDFQRIAAHEKETLRHVATARETTNDPKVSMQRIADDGSGTGRGTGAVESSGVYPSVRIPHGGDNTSTQPAWWAEHQQQRPPKQHQQQNPIQPPPRHRPTPTLPEKDTETRNEQNDGPHKGAGGEGNILQAFSSTSVPEKEMDDQVVQALINSAGAS